MIFHVALTTNEGTIRFSFPRALARPLLERGYNRATIEVTERGFLIKPYVTSDVQKFQRADIELPDWDADASAK